MKTITALNNLKKCKLKDEIIDHRLNQEVGNIFQNGANPRNEYLGTGFREEKENPPLLPPIEMVPLVF